MKKLLTSFVLAVSGLLFAAPQAAFQDFSIDPAAASVKAGTMLKLNVSVLCADGYKLQSISVYVHRKNAPASFFATPGLVMNRFEKKDPKKDSQYDAVYAVSNYLKQAVEKGIVPVQINTAGLTPGDYAFAVQGYFTKPESKSVYSAVYYCVTITEGDNGKFAQTPQTQPDSVK